MFKTYKYYILINNHLLVLDKKCIKITSKGRFLSDGIASDLFMLN